MKKIFCAVLACIILLSSTVVIAANGLEDGDEEFNYYYIDENYENSAKNNSTFINGREYFANDGYIIRYKNFQLPVKPVQDGLGAKVNWNSKTHIITITCENVTLVMNLDKNLVKVNGFEIKNSLLTTGKRNKTTVLIKFIAQALGKNAEINEGENSDNADDYRSTSINDNTLGNGLRQFEYSGNWSYGTQAAAYHNDNHWSAGRNAYYKIRFTGTQIKLYGATASNHGIAAVSVDNGRETYVDFYSANRADNVLLYTSPVLSQGQHTIKVRVSGTKNIKSWGTSITADRVSIYSNDINRDESNIALNKSSFTDSQQSGNEAYKGIDGNTSTRWCASDGSLNHWWTVDLEDLYNISSSQITWERSNKVYKYKIEVSADNHNWTLMVNKTGSYSKQQVQTDSFNTDAVRYVRITVTGLEPGCWASFSEFKAFGQLSDSYIDN